MYIKYTHIKSTLSSTYFFLIYSCLNTAHTGLSLGLVRVTAMSMRGTYIDPVRAGRCNFMQALGQCRINFDHYTTFD